MSESLSVTLSPAIWYTIIAGGASVLGFKIWKEHNTFKLKREERDLIASNDNYMKYKSGVQKNHEELVEQETEVLDEEEFDNYSDTPSDRLKQRTANGRTPVIDNYESGKGGNLNTL